MNARTDTIYVTKFTRRDAETAALIAGASCADEWAETVLRRELDAIPAIGELRDAIGRSIKAVKEKWALNNNVTKP